MVSKIIGTKQNTTHIMPFEYILSVYGLQFLVEHIWRVHGNSLYWHKPAGTHIRESNISKPTPHATTASPCQETLRIQKVPHVLAHDMAPLQLHDNQRLKEGLGACP